ncbi:MAG: hypothetical protein OXT65_10410 [Alphaproteobacteria bacterium]|nr:hypothetical protein [Alphaproteobacteria bacterium]
MKTSALLVAAIFLFLSAPANACLIQDEELASMFAAADTNNDNSVSHDEYMTGAGNAAKNMPEPYKSAFLQNVKTRFTENDKDGDKALSAEEFYPPVPQQRCR